MTTIAQAYRELDKAYKEAEHATSALEVSALVIKITRLQARYDAARFNDPVQAIDDDTLLNALKDMT